MGVKSYRENVKKELGDALRRKNEAAAILTENSVKRETPVDTGRLRSGQTHDSDASGFVVGTNIRYGVFVHEGTRYIRPNPWLVRGLLKAIPDIKRVYSGD